MNIQNKSVSRALQNLELVEFWILGNCKDLNSGIFTEKLPKVNYCSDSEGLLISILPLNSFFCLET